MRGNKMKGLHLAFCPPVFLLFVVLLLLSSKGEKSNKTKNQPRSVGTFRSRWPRDATRLKKYLQRKYVRNPYNLNFMKNIKANTAGNVYRQRDCSIKIHVRRKRRKRSLRLSTLNIYTCFYERENEFKNKERDQRLTCCLRNENSIIARFDVRWIFRHFKYFIPIFNIHCSSRKLAIFRS